MYVVTNVLDEYITSALKMEAICSSERLVTIQKVRGVVFQETTVQFNDYPIVIILQTNGTQFS
jgi:hypothetical protein